MYNTAKVLFVDDDLDLTNSYKKYFSEKFDIFTAVSAEAAFLLAENQWPIAVVVCNVNMPDMSGVDFLYKFRKLYPNTRRLIVSAHKNDETLIKIISKARVYHFLTKPCPLELLELILNKAIKRYEYITAEKNFIDKVINETVTAFCDILALTNPVAFSRCSRISVMVKHIAEKLQLAEPWRYEVAGKLSQIGAVAISPETIDKMYNNIELDYIEIKMLKELPKRSHDLINDIPKLQDIAKMVLGQNDNFTGPPMPPIPKITNEKWINVPDPDYDPYAPINLEYLGDITMRDNVLLGAELLRVGIDLEKLIGIGYELADAVAELKLKKDAYNPSIIAVLNRIVLPQPKKKILSVPVTELNKWMQFEEDIRSKSGAFIASKGKMINTHMKEIIEKYHEQHNIQETVKVSIPFYPD